MNIKNAVYKNLAGTIIDVEIQHPTFGWIPYTYISNEPDTGFDIEIAAYLETETIADYIGPSLETLKKEKKEEINIAFVNAASNGRFTSALGFDVNARRSGIQNDLQNVETLISLNQTIFRDADNTTRNVTALDLVTIKTEIQQHGLSLYEHKWELEADIEAALTEEEINAIEW